MIGDNHQIRQHKIFRWMLVILLATGLGVAIGFGKKVSLTEIPDVVQDTIVREIGQALIDKIDRDKDDDEIVYEVDAEGDGIDIELKISSDGTLQKKKVEEEITLSELPQVVRNTITREIRNLWIEEVRRKTKLGGRVSYEIEARGEGKEIDLEVAADGWVLYKKVDDADDDDNDDLLRIEAELLAKSTSPTLADIAPYRDALAFYEYHAQRGKNPRRPLGDLRQATASHPGSRNRTKASVGTSSITSIPPTGEHLHQRYVGFKSRDSTLSRYRAANPPKPVGGRTL